MGTYIYPIKREFLNLSGGTVTGDTTFSVNLSANTISAQNLFVQTLTSQNSTVVFSNSAPSTGNTWVRTLDYEFFIYDEIRNKWLSPSVQKVSGSRNNTIVTDQFLRHYDGTPFNLAGYLLPYDSTIVGMLAESNSAQTWQALINTGSTITDVLYSLPIHTSINASNIILNLDVNSGDTVYLALSGDSINFPRVDIYLKRKAT